jgi:hypothetical protein
MDTRGILCHSVRRNRGFDGLTDSRHGGRNVADIVRVSGVYVGEVGL